jgi:CMP-2-keto-3-deoxyoctulosonic acid synthetase
MKQETPTKQDLSILAIQKDIEFIKCEIVDIKTNHLHEIKEETKTLQSEIQCLKDELNKRPTWGITMLISVCLALMSFILGNFIR